MDNLTTLVLLTIVFALVAIFAFVVYKRRAKVHIKGPLGTELNIDAENESPKPASGVKVEDAKNRSGGLAAEDEKPKGQAHAAPAVYSVR